MLKQIVVLLAFVAFAAHGFPGGKIKCGSSISSKTFTLSNPSNPPNDCVYKVKSYSSKVCQLRLDIEMVLAAPTVSNVQSGRNNTKCVDDFLEIGEYKFCGREPNQHIYIPFSEKTTEIRVFSSSRSGGSLLPRVSWNIRVKQLECPKGLSASSVLPYSDFDLLAPAGCLQYFQEKTGLISSFNLDSGRGSYTSGLSYAICLKRTSETQGVKFRGDYFNLGSNTNNCTASFNEDFMSVPLGNSTNIFCGEGLQNKTIVSGFPGPISFVVNSANNQSKQTSSKGFLISYELF